LALNAVAFPIPLGKTAEWRSFMGELNGPRRAEYTDARRRAGVHERIFLQQTPMGDLVIVTLEGDDPTRSFDHDATDAFTTWFHERIQAIHGIDMRGPSTRSPSELVLDSERAADLA
jgi:hypothetical protein